jgi:hypothetical protein
MRSLKSSIVAVSVAAFFGAAAVVGCSASGGGDDLGTDTNDTDPTGGSASLPPPSNPGSTDDTPPSSSKDGGKGGTKGDAGKDAGPPPPNPGDPCTKVDAVTTKPCGACGTQQAICQSSGGDGGALTWSDYGVCQGELAGGCTPGTTEACGNCGTHTCSKYCGWDSCKEPAGACTPGKVDYTAAGCSTANTYRSRTCGDTCAFSGYSSTCAAPNNPNKMQISGTVNGTTSKDWSLTATNVGSRLGIFGSGCPATVSTGNYPFVAVEVQNTTSKKATVTIQSLPGAPTDLDIVIWAYNNTLPAQDDTALAACDYPGTDSCPSGSGVTCPSGYWGGLKDVTINAGASVLVYLASYWDADDTFESSTGTVNLTLKTTALQ